MKVAHQLGIGWRVLRPITCFQWYHRSARWGKGSFLIQDWNSSVGAQIPSESSLKSGILLDGSGWVDSYSPEATTGCLETLGSRILFTGVGPKQHRPGWEWWMHRQVGVKGFSQ